MNRFLHDGSLGDLVYSLPTIKKLGGGIIYSRKKVKIICEKLLSLQSYIVDVKYKKELYNITDYINLNRFREYALASPTLHLGMCHAAVCNIDIDLSVPWLENIEATFVSPIIVNCTLKYQDNATFPWELLQNYKEIVTYIGGIVQYKGFVYKYKVDIPYYNCENIVDAAKVIKGSKIFIGNQSLCFALAEGMKHPRILEVYSKFPNCMPHGKDGHTILSEDIIEVYLNGR